jgi:hypothetical protein
LSTSCTRPPGRSDFDPAPTSAGFEVSTASTLAPAGSSCLGVPGNGRNVPSVMIADLRLPGELNGLQLARHPSEEAKGRLPTIIVSGDTDEKYAEETRAAGCRLLYKPRTILTASAGRSLKHSANGIRQANTSSQHLLRSRQPSDGPTPPSEDTPEGGWSEPEPPLQRQRRSNGPGAQLQPCCWRERLTTAAANKPSAGSRRSIGSVIRTVVPCPDDSRSEASHRAARPRPW